MASIDSSRIIDLVDAHTARGAVLYDFGLPFYQYPEATLLEACRARGLNASSVARRLEMASFFEPSADCEELRQHDAAAVIAYLRQAHGWFIRRKLPYMANLIANIAPQFFDSPALAKDLKFVFPLFVEDFIRHIHAEEDTVFAHIMRLYKAVEARKPTARLFFSMKRYSIAGFAEHHLNDDDEMEGIREMTDQYALNAQSTTYTKVIYHELQAFERVLRIHAKMEDEILMPKALRLEAHASDLLRHWAKKN